MTASWKAPALAQTWPIVPPNRRWLERVGALLMREPEDREQLLELLRSAYERNLLDADALSMIEGVLQVSEMQARDIMIPRAQMDVIDISEPTRRIHPAGDRDRPLALPGHRARTRTT